jgi:HD-GYP domain-containing protein (c-di-GMP phosphodiesterase class II)
MEGSEWRRVVLFSLAGLGAFMVEVVLHVIFTGRMFGGRTRHGVTSSISDAAVFASLLATGALFGLSYEAIDEWAFAVAVLPYAFTAGAFRRLSQTKGTYEQTLVALAQIPEVGGHTPIGHAARTNELATAVAERIGVSPRDYEQIKYASFLHDIGRITLNEPSILRQGFTDVDLAGWGAEIVGETKYLEDVATIVRRQHEPFRSPGEVSNPDLPLASRIIKVCSAYDESVHEMGFSPLEALERIHRGTVYDFDPDVVRELREVLERRGMLNHPASVTPG